MQYMYILYILVTCMTYLFCFVLPLRLVNLTRVRVIRNYHDVAARITLSTLKQVNVVSQFGLNFVAFSIVPKKFH